MNLLGFGGATKRTDNSRAVVTGAGSGIGRAFALELAQRGGQVVCSDIDPGRAKETVELIEAGDGDAMAHTCDVSDRGADLAFCECFAMQLQPAFLQHLIDADLAG